MNSHFYKYSDLAKRHATSLCGYSDWAEGVCFGLCISGAAEWWQWDGLRNELNYIRNRVN